MNDDIVDQIRAEARKQTTLGQAFDMLRVADEIERLRIEERNLTDEVDWLRRQLRAAVLIITHYNDDPDATEGVYATIIKEAE